jgi:cobalt transporter subunit CbtB
MQIETAHIPIGAKDVSVVFQAVLAMALGLLIIGIVGFSPIDVVHSATHDVRHSIGLPCH